MSNLHLYLYTIISQQSIILCIQVHQNLVDKVYTIFAYQNVVQSDITIESPYLTGTIYASEDVTVDIEDGVTVTVDDGAVLNIITI